MGQCVSYVGPFPFPLWVAVVMAGHSLGYWLGRVGRPRDLGLVADNRSAGRGPEGPDYTLAWCSSRETGVLGGPHTSWGAPAVAMASSQWGPGRTLLWYLAGPVDLDWLLLVPVPPISGHAS